MGKSLTNLSPLGIFWCPDTNQTSVLENMRCNYYVYRCLILFMFYQFDCMIG